ncbi:putative peptidase family-domain-containing protein [Massariosphaeria phaeospora]|uniref:Putative peptidase family-domain-containing protein n=1 Tax=Massariosphaeria phaeospora TaxID=100035 RepID=A0A7C8I4Z3_9PLEO|nr:putative peptidase family-domain-containing protein [Massariosphaeria phaeospora]
MTLLRSSLLLLGVSSAFASPARVIRQETVTVTATPSAAAPTATAWDAGAVTSWTIHSSCNRTERAQLERAFGETITLVNHARDHILRWGNASELYQKYFGDASTGEPVGWFGKIANGDKAGVIFRCDNPDGNCAQEGWAGHWRGENATSETVICPLSYETRKPLEAMCGHGYTVANSNTNFYFASDLLHRLLHIPQVGEGIVEHYAEDYPEVLELAENTPSEAVKNSDTLQYFALEAYAYDIALPGEGCPGKYTATSEAPVASATETPTATTNKRKAKAIRNATPTPTVSCTAPEHAVMSETNS